MTRLLSHLAGALVLTAATSCALFSAPEAHAQALVEHRALQTAAVRASAPAFADPTFLAESSSVTLAGNTSPLALAANDQGVVASSTVLSGMVLSLAPSAQQESNLDALLAQQQDPASANYHQWLTPAQFGARFGASAAQIAQVSSWLQSNGFTIDQVAPSGRIIVFSGTAAQVQDAFHAAIHSYLVNGALHMANNQDPQIPAALASAVSGVVSLNDFHSASSIASRTEVPATKSGTSGLQPMYSAGSTHYFFPADFAAIYDVAPLATAGLSGSGVTIAIAGRSNIALADIAAFRATAGLSAAAPNVILPTTDPGLTSTDRDEATLDVEWSSAAAPSANITLVTAPSTSTTDGIDIASAYIVNHNIGSIVSVSYANCESSMGSTELAFYNALWKQAAAQGQTVLVASGDAGAAGCQAGSATKGTAAAVNGLCSSPYATCVGGTEFNDASGSYWAASNSSSYGSALGYIPEVVWNESASNAGTDLWASGGGASRTYAQPAWQSNVSGASQANGMRAVPDVALNAAAHDGAMIEESSALYVVSGTSVAAPSLAGILALAVQKSGVSLGNANARLYALAQSNPAAFHATASGNNSVPGVSGYIASGTTYNLATGLGSVDAAQLVDNWVPASTTPDFTLSAAATSSVIAQGASASLILSVAGSAKTAVTLSATAPSGITVSFAAASVAPGSSTAVTIAIGDTVAAGTQQIVLSASDASGQQTVSYALTVTVPPAISVAVSPSIVTVTPGATAQVAVTITTSGSYSGAVTLALSGSHTGVDATWSSNSFTPGVASTTVTLTLSATSRAALTTSTLLVTATGDGLTATQAFTLQVQPPTSCTKSGTLLLNGCGTTAPIRVIFNPGQY